MAHTEIFKKVDDLNRLYLQIRGVKLKVEVDGASFLFCYAHGKENNYKNIHLISTENAYEADIFLRGVEAGIAFGTLNVLL